MRRPLGRKLYYSIGEVSELAQLQPYTLRAWEKEFSCLRPRRVRGKNRAYRERDIGIILLIKRLLYEERYSTRGVRQKLKKDPELIQRAVDAVAKLTAAPQGSEVAVNFDLGDSVSSDSKIEPSPSAVHRDQQAVPPPRPPTSTPVDAELQSETAVERKERVEAISRDLREVIELLS